MKYFQRIMVLCFSLLSMQAFAIETSMTQEAKQQTLDSLTVYEQQQITQLSVQNIQSDQTTHNRIFCVGEDCPKGTQKQPEQANEVFDESKPMVHRVSLYFLNDAPFQERYQHRSESFFRLKGEELELFKDTVLYHYLGHDREKMKAKLIVTRPKYVALGFM